MCLQYREWQSKHLTWNIFNFLQDRGKTGICRSQIPHPRVLSLPGLGALELLGSFFPAGIPGALDLSLLFAPNPLGNFHPFPLPLFLGFLLIWSPRKFLGKLQNPTQESLENSPQSRGSYLTGIFMGFNGF